MSDLDEARAFLEGLSPLKVSRDGPYKPIDRYRDFKMVFSTEAGQKVLRQIIDRCEGRMPLEEHSHAVHAGYIARRRIGLWILDTSTVPPVVED